MGNGDPRFDLLRFGLEKDQAKGGVKRLWQALRASWSSTLKALGWMVLGYRLRARMRIRALIGDRIRQGAQRISLASRLSGEPVSSPMEVEAGVIRTACGADGAILLFCAPDCRWPPDVEGLVEAFFRLNEGVQLAFPNAVAHAVPGIGDIPVLPPQFNQEQWCSLAPVAPAVAIRAEWLDALGGWPGQVPGMEYAALALETAKRAGDEAVARLDGVVVAWDARQSEVPVSVEQAETLRTARLEVAAHYAPEGAILSISDAGVVNVQPHVPSLPRVSLLVPTRDRIDLLRPCVEGVLTGTDYPDLELIIIDNGSRAKETLYYLAQLVEDSRVKVIRDDGPFNYSALNNRAAEVATGQVLVLLNNDITIPDPQWLRLMVAQAIRPEVGAVGALLLYPSGLVQHAGVVLGLDGLAGHAFQFFPGDHAGYLHQLRTTRRVSAVTGACLVVETSKYRAVGGLDEENFPVSLNDVDFCLRLDRAGLHNLMVPQARLYHHESATRASDRVSSQRPRWEAEKAAFLAKWASEDIADRWYHPDLGQQMADFALPDIEWQTSG